MNHQVLREVKDGVSEAAATLGLWTRGSLLAWKFAVMCVCVCVPKGSTCCRGVGEMTAGAFITAHVRKRSHERICANHHRHKLRLTAKCQYCAYENISDCSGSKYWPLDT